MVSQFIRDTSNSLIQKAPSWKLDSIFADLRLSRTNIKSLINSIKLIRPIKRVKLTCLSTSRLVVSLENHQFSHLLREKALNTMDTRRDVLINHNHFLGFTKDKESDLVIKKAKTLKRIFYSYLKGILMKQTAKSLKADDVLADGTKTYWFA